jgi:hypothetical protein
MVAYDLVDPLIVFSASRHPRDKRNSLFLLGAEGALESGSFHKRSD